MIDLTMVRHHRIAIYGTGLFGLKCMYNLQIKNISIEYFLESNCNIKSFCHVPVYELELSKIKNIFIIVSTNEHTYSIVSKELSEMGLEEFKDYIFYSWIGKKIVLLHGNCHLDVIGEYLNSSEKFQKEYAIYPNPRIYDNKEHRIRDNILYNCDVWIHEDIKEDNPFGYYLSDKYLRKQFKKNTKDITIPNLFGLGRAFFPQQDPEVNKKNCSIFNARDLNGMFPRADIVIDKCIQDGKNVEDTYLFTQRQDVFNKKDVFNNFSIYMKKIKEREKNWDIKIYNYIMDHYKYEKLFFDIGHPTNVILKKISSDILEMLNIDDKEIFAQTQLDAHEIPVYPSVRKHLGMEWNENEIRKGKKCKKVEEVMDFKEYVREYIWWCYTLRNEKND